MVKNPVWAREVAMRKAAERHAQDPKSLARAIRIVQAGIRAELVTATEVLAVQK